MGAVLRATVSHIAMNEIREWLTQHSYSLVSEIITVNGEWLLQVRYGNVGLPVILIARDVEQPQRGIAAIESLFKAIAGKP